MTSATTTVEGPKGKGSHKLLAAAAVLLGVVMVALVLFSHRGLYQIYRFRHERVALEQENARLAEENARLARTIDRLQNDPEMIQDLIRRDLNFVKKNEIIFQLPPGSRKKPATASTAAGGSPEAPPAKPEASSKAWSWESVEGAPLKGSSNPR